MTLNQALIDSFKRKTGIPQLETAFKNIDISKGSPQDCFLVLPENSYCIMDGNNHYVLCLDRIVLNKEVNTMSMMENVAAFFGSSDEWGDAIRSDTQLVSALNGIGGQSVLGLLESYENKDNNITPLLVKKRPVLAIPRMDMFGAVANWEREHTTHYREGKFFGLLSRITQREYHSLS